MNEIAPARLAIRIKWDPDASVWVAESDDIPGLITEADTLAHLLERLRSLIPELVEVNGAATWPPLVEFYAHTRLRIEAEPVRDHQSFAEGSAFVDVAIIDLCVRHPQRDGATAASAFEGERRFGPDNSISSGRFDMSNDPSE